MTRHVPHMPIAWSLSYFKQVLSSYLDHLATTRHYSHKYMMQTYQASVRVAVKGRTQLVKTEVRAINAQEARWLLWAQYGFHSIQSGPNKATGK